LAHDVTHLSRGRSLPGAAELAQQDRKGHNVLQRILIVGVGLAAVLLTAFILVKGQSSPAAPSPPASAARTAKTVTFTRKPATVTYLVSGTPGATVSYGPVGSDFGGQTPLRVTKPFGKSSYFGITAQLQAGGSVECEILFGTEVISKSVATGAYNVVSCQARKIPRTSQARKNPRTDRWLGTFGG
jgi:hypothetical protein